MEGTAGNTGISLLCKVMQEAINSNCSSRNTEPRKRVLRICGADLRLVPAVPYKDPHNYVRYSEKLFNDLSKESSQGVIWANQFDNI